MKNKPLGLTGATLMLVGAAIFLYGNYQSAHNSASISGLAYWPYGIVIVILGGIFTLVAVREK